MSAEPLRILPVPSQIASPSPTNAPLLVDSIEAARLLGVSPRTLWDLTERGEVPCKRLGRRKLYNRAMLEEFARK